MSMSKQVAAFREMHASGCVVLANAWDAGSAKLLASLGFKALATSSAALGFVLGRPDTVKALGVDDALANVRAVATATDLPVNADFQNGYGATPDAVAENVRRCVEAGAAGLSIEDATGDANQPLFELSDAIERLTAARATIDATGSGVVLTARCEAFLVGDAAPLETALERLTAFADAGADCLFAPGVSTPEQVRDVVAAVAPRPVNVLAIDPSWMTVGALTELGVRRISVGSAIARAGWGAVLLAAQDIAESGSFKRLQRAMPFDDLNSMFS